MSKKSTAERRNAAVLRFVEREQLDGAIMLGVYIAESRICVTQITQVDPISTNPTDLTETLSASIRKLFTRGCFFECGNLNPNRLREIAAKIEADHEHILDQLVPQGNA